MKCSKLDVDQKKGDVYGQTHAEESASFVETKLEEFQSSLDNIPRSNRQYAWEADTKCPELVTNDFKLMFLRCEVFNAELAVKRYVKYWDKRVDVFGHEKAFLPLTQDGALRDDSLALHNGYFRLTGTKGVGGRNIFFCDPTLQDFKYSQDSMLRAVWYMFHAALEDEDTQKHGFIFILYALHAQMCHFDRKLMERVVASVQGTLPVRLSGLHFCRPPMALSAVFPLVKVLLGKRLRKRVKIHNGSDASVQKELDKYGLARNAIPVEIGGELVLNHEQWLEQRRLEGK